MFIFFFLDMLLRLKKLQTGRGRIYLEDEAAHLYSQWQSCLSWSLNLNGLLLDPLSEPECARYNILYYS